MVARLSEILLFAIAVLGVLPNSAAFSSDFLGAGALDDSSRFRNVTLEELASSLCYAYLAYYPEEVLNAASSWSCRHQGGYSIVRTNKTQRACPEETVVALEYDKLTVVRNDTYNLYGYVSYSHEKRLVVVSFRGTDRYSIKNWLENISFLKTSPYSHYPNLELHRGFYHAFSSVRFAMWKAVKGALNACAACNRVHFVGHSLGGSIASVGLAEAIIDGFLDLYRTKKRDVRSGEEFDVGLRTFGQPRTGNDAFFHLLKNYSVWRVVREQDMIPHTPPSYAGYHHLSTELWETSSILKTPECTQKLIFRCDETGEDILCSNSYLVSHSISDHYSYLGMDSPVALPGKLEPFWSAPMAMNLRLAALSDRG